MIDVAIAGAGPAGSTLAAVLAARGCSVVLIDRDSFPRDKVCGEFLSYDAIPILERLGIDLNDFPAITRCRIQGRRRMYEFEFPLPARGVSRFRLDEMLLRKAADFGAQAWTSCSIGGLSSTRVVTDRGEVDARVVVGAWGRWGRFDSQLDRPFVRDRAHRNFGFKRHYRFASGDEKNVISLFPFRRGYLGVSAIEGETINMCGLVHVTRVSRDPRGWNALVDDIRQGDPKIDEFFRRHEPAQKDFLSSTPVVFRPRAAVENGIFTVGDASGVIDPLTGSGMAMAMQSALLAAPCILDALAGKRGDAEREYSRRHAEFFASRISWSRRIAWLLPRPRLLDAALATARPSAGTFLLRKTRATDRQIETLLRSLRSAAA